MPSSTHNMGLPPSELLLALQLTDPGCVRTEAERHRVRDALYQAYRRMQTPWEVALETSLQIPCLHAAIQTLLDLDIFRKWALNPSTKTVQELAAMSGASPSLLRRLLRILGSHYLVVPIAEDTYAPTPWSLAFGDDQEPQLHGVYRGFRNVIAEVTNNLPAYLRSIGYANPVSSASNNSHHCFGLDKTGPRTFYEHVAIDPQRAQDMSDAFAIHAKYQNTPWLSMYPTCDIAAAATLKPDRALVVDIGGGNGHDLLAFHHAHPGLPRASLICQDLPLVVAGLKDLPPTIKPQAHDFFTPQPVSGARMYMLHNTLQDWDDERAHVILKNTAAAMEPGWSKLLVQTTILTTIDPPARLTSIDIVLMATLGAYERTEEDWDRILSRAGLRVVKAWRPVESDSPEVMIECEVVEQNEKGQRRSHGYHYTPTQAQSHGGGGGHGVNGHTNRPERGMSHSATNGAVGRTTTMTSVTSAGLSSVKSSSKQSTSDDSVGEAMGLKKKKKGLRKIWTWTVFRPGK